MKSLSVEHIRKTLHESRANLHEAKHYIFLAAGIFLGGAATGFLFPAHFETVIRSFEGLVTRFEGKSGPVLILMIFVQNFSSAFLSLWAGALLGIIPAFGALWNGVLLGAVISIAAVRDPFAIFLGLIPHGVFELPAIFIAWGLGLWRGAWLVRQNKEQSYRERALKAYRVFFTVVTPLLIIAAIIEGLSISAITKP